MCRRISLLAWSVHMHIRRWHIRTIRVLPVVRWRCLRRGRVWWRDKHRTGIVCQHGRCGKVLPMCKWGGRWSIPHIIHVCAATGQLIWRRTWLFRLTGFWWRWNWPWRRFLVKFSLVLCSFVQLSTFCSSVFEPYLEKEAKCHLSYQLWYHYSSVPLVRLFTWLEKTSVTFGAELKLNLKRPQDRLSVASSLESKTPITVSCDRLLYLSS